MVPMNLSFALLFSLSAPVLDGAPPVVSGRELHGMQQSDYGADVPVAAGTQEKAEARTGDEICPDDLPGSHADATESEGLPPGQDALVPPPPRKGPRPNVWDPNAQTGVGERFSRYSGDADEYERVEAAPSESTRSREPRRRNSQARTSSGGRSSTSTRVRRG